MTGKGKMRGHGIRCAWPERVLVACDPGVAAGVRKHLEGFVVMEDVTITDCSAELEELWVHGPGAVAAAERALGLSLPRELAAHQFVRIEYAGEALMVARENPTGEEGLALFAVPAIAAALRRALAAALPEVEAEALEILRVEGVRAGARRWCGIGQAPLSPHRRADPRSPAEA